MCEEEEEEEEEERGNFLLLLPVTSPTVQPPRGGGSEAFGGLLGRGRGCRVGDGYRGARAGTGGRREAESTMLNRPLAPPIWGKALE